MFRIFGILLLLVFAAKSFAQTQSCLAEIQRIDNKSLESQRKVTEFDQFEAISGLNNLEFKAFKEYEKSFLLEDEFLIEMSFSVLVDKENFNIINGYKIKISEYYSEDSLVEYVYSIEGKLLKYSWLGENNINNVHEYVCEGFEEINNKHISNLYKNSDFIFDDNSESELLNNVKVVSSDELPESILKIANQIIINSDSGSIANKQFEILKNNKVIGYILNILDRSDQQLGLSVFINKNNLKIINYLDWK